MSTPAFDPLRYKALQRHQWGVSASGWKQHWSLWERAAQHVSVRLLDLAHIDVGHRVLDLATGLGEPALTAARRVGPTGRVVATDLSPQMLALAREKACALGLQNIEFREMDAEAPDLPLSTFQAILCRWGLMFLPQLTTALSQLRQLLVPGGWFAAAVWGPPRAGAGHQSADVRDPAGTTDTTTARRHARTVQFSRCACCGACLQAGRLYSSTNGTAHRHARICLSRRVHP